MPSLADYGTWSSPITPELLTKAQVGLSGPLLDRGEVYWLEGRPEEAGRQVLVRLNRGEAIDDLTPTPFNVRTRVHEYGGGAAAVADGVIIAVNFSDQRLYRLRPGSPPVPITPESERKLRYADFAIEPGCGNVYAVREDHRGDGEAINTIVRLNLSSEDDPGEIVAEGHDFFAAPRLSPDGKKLAWLSWDHPNMPWDGTDLWLADLQDDGGLGEIRKIAGGVDEAIVQPSFSPDGTLYFISDRSGWWNVYRHAADGARAICPMEAEFGGPAWGFGQSTFGFLSNEQLLAGYYKDGRWNLIQIDAESGRTEAVPFPFISLSGLSVHHGQAFMRVGSVDAQAAIIRLDIDSGAIDTLKSAGDVAVSRDQISIPESLAFPTEGGATAYAFYYPPNNPDFKAPEGQTPPLIVKSHGGPTGNTSSQLNLATQFWTSRGFAVCDVDYGGGTGYG
ncbi:MAG: S9 family peptidase, partial [Geminicoccaceae bacterium]